MPLTEEQRNLRAVMFPGKRGKLEKSDQKVFAQACAEQGFPLDETSKPAGRRGPKRVTYKEATSSDEGNDEGSDSDEAELEELADQDKEENGRGGMCPYTACFVSELHDTCQCPTWMSPRV